MSTPALKSDSSEHAALDPVDQRPDVVKAYGHCRGITQRSQSSFAAAFWMFPRAERRALHAIYAFCRLADDIADDPSLGGDRTLLLKAWRTELDQAYQGRSTHPVGVALGDAVRRFDLPYELFEELLAGIESDLLASPIDTFEDLYRYCYRVASTIGLLVVRVLGCRSPRALAYAEAMGIAVQLTNVLRDVGEDAEAGRVYLPAEDLARFGVTPDSLKKRKLGDELRLLLAHYAERARIFYDRAASLQPPEDRRSLRAADAMGRIYRTLLDDLQRRGFPCMERSLRLSKVRRIGIAASCWFGLRR